MTATFDVQAINVINCSSMDDFQEQILSIYERIEEDGFAIIQGWDTSDEAFKEVVQCFGHIQAHPNTDDSGLVKLRPVRPKKAEHAYERSPAHTSGDFLPHTDGAYLDGFAVINGKVVRVNPPSFLILQCIRPAEQGGVSFLVDTQEIFERLWVEEPEHAKIVIQPRSVSYCAGVDFSAHCPLFEQLSEERWRVRLRPDIMYIEPWAYSSVQYVVHNYLFNPKFRKFHRLTEGQILIADNYRVLHGRDAIMSDRLLNKTWVWDASTETNCLLPFRDLPPDPKSFQAFEKHHPLNIDVANKTVRPIQTGIKIKSRIRSLD